MTTASADPLVTALWNVDRIPLLRLVAREGVVGLREVRRAFPGVDATEIYRQFVAYRRWGWVLLHDGPKRIALRPGVLERFARVLDQVRPGAEPAEVFDELELRWEIEALMHKGAFAPGGRSQLRLLSLELEGGGDRA